MSDDREYYQEEGPDEDSIMEAFRQRYLEYNEDDLREIGEQTELPFRSADFGDDFFIGTTLDELMPSDILDGKAKCMKPKQYYKGGYNE